MHRALIVFLLFAVVSPIWAIGHNEQQCDAHIAGTFSYYKLAISRSKEWCYSKNKTGDAQCNLEYSVHGLWPQCDSGYPADCKLPSSQSEDAIDTAQIMDIMPSKYLIKHEWEKHGRCAGVKRSQYFQTLKSYYQGLHLPVLRRGSYTHRQLISLIIAQQPRLRAEHIELACDEEMRGPRASATTLDEIRICFNRSGQFTACTEKENSCSKLNKIEVRN
ncbi:MAG: hypothetical protein OEW08_02445 [Gammaproteobacteria bacterium]|nr:hypothetical protein [Gammaproteobacteria bacterium]